MMFGEKHHANAVVLLLVLILIAVAIADVELAGLGQPAGAPAPSTPAPPGTTGVAAFKAYAAALNLNAAQFASCLDFGETAAAVQKDYQDGITAGVSGTPTFFVNSQKVIGAQPYSVFKAAIDQELASPTQLSVSTAGAASKGPAAATVTMVEFSDFQCPFCERFFQQTEGQVLKDYVDTGKVRFVYRHFPLSSIHPLAQKAAEAAACAQKQGKFWEMHDTLFQKQSEWAA